jgi:hypothetical protein
MRILGRQIIGGFVSVVLGLASLVVLTGSGSATSVGTTVSWMGNGVTDGHFDTVQCSGDTPNPGDVFWVLTASGADSATITINSGSAANMTQQGNGAFHYLQTGFNGDFAHLTASATYLGESHGNVNLVISHGCPAGGQGGGTDCDGDNDESPASECEQPETGSITVVKHLSPTTDGGLFDLKVGATVVASNVGNNGSGTANGLTAGDYVVAETAGTNTVLSNYASTLSCTDQTTGTTSATVHLTAGEDVTCTFTNTHGGQGGGTPDCDGDFDNSASTECQPTGGQGGGTVTTATTTTTTPTATPTGGVNAGGGFEKQNLGSLAGVIASVGIMGLGVRRINREY